MVGEGKPLIAWEPSCGAARLERDLYGGRSVSRVLFRRIKQKEKHYQELEEYPTREKSPQACGQRKRCRLADEATLWMAEIKDQIKSEREIRRFNELQAANGKIDVDKGRTRRKKAEKIFAAFVL